MATRADHGGHRFVGKSYLYCYIALGRSDWPICEILAIPALQEKATRFQVAIFHSISREL